MGGYNTPDRSVNVGHEISPGITEASSDFSTKYTWRRQTERNSTLLINDSSLYILLTF